MPARSQPVMGRPLVAVRRHPLAAYFLLAYTFSWSYWLPVALTGGHLSHFPGLLGPMLSALLVTGIVQGRTGLRELLSRMGRWRVPLRWYALAAAPAAAGLLALCGLWLAGGDLPSPTQLSTMPGLPTIGWVGVLLLALAVNGYGEETGWRGFAWPRLRERHGLGGAALLLAVPWAVWHIPTFWLDTGMRGFPLLLLPGFLVGMAAGAVVLGWLYERARCSVLVVALFHALLNMASATKGTEGLVAAAVSTVVIVWAVAILRVEGRRGGSQGTGAGRRHVPPSRAVA
jgi:membrane protease YdiL (CAAX protease family)